MIRRSPFDRLFPALPILLILGLYLGLSFSGIRFGLPNNDHPLSYDCDELQWIEALMHVRSAERHHNPYPELDHPTFYMEIYGAALGAAALVHWIPLHADKEWYNQHRDVFARVFLTGRILQIVFGSLLLIAMWSVARIIFGPQTATLAALLTAVCPAFVATSTFSQNNMPVTAMAFLSLSCLLMDQHVNGLHRRWLFLGAFLAGLAMSTKYSAAPVLLVLAWRSWQSSARGKTILLVGALVGLGFMIGDPFALVFPQAFAQGYMYMQRCLIYNVDTLWYRTVFPFIVTLPHALGFWLTLTVLACVALNSTQWKRNTALWIWSLTFWLGFLVVGRNATPGRSLVFLPPLLLLTASQLFLFKKNYRVPPFAFYTGITALILATLLPTLSIISIRRSKPIQDEASDWIRASLPAHSSVGTPRYIFWWTPPIIYQSAYHPERMAAAYRVYDLNYSAERTAQIKPDYLVISGTERELAPPETHFFEWLDGGAPYQVIKVFPRRVGWGGWRWDRPELRLHFDDDLWQTSISIYQRAEVPLILKTKPQ